MASKTKVTVNGLAAVEKKLTKFLTEAVQDREMLQDVAETARKSIVERTRGRQEEYKQPALKPGTKATRQELINQGNSHGSFVTAQTSNLSMSNQLLDAIYFIINVAKATITYKLKDERTPYKYNYTGYIPSSDKKRTRARFNAYKASLEKKTNNQIKDELEKRGFRFFFLSERLQAQLTNRIKQLFRRKLSNYRKLSRLSK